jgi:4-carboxymuconolactone decarboxylase
MARIDYCDVADAEDELKLALANRSKLNIFSMLAHAGAAAPMVLDLGQCLSRRSALDPAQRELILLRVGHACDAEYELSKHRRAARRAGLSDEKIEAVAAFPGTSEIFTDFEQLLLYFTDSVLDETRMPDDLFEAVSKELDARQLVEVFLLIGFYRMVSRVMTHLDVDIEPLGDFEKYQLALI